MMGYQAKTILTRSSLHRRLAGTGSRLAHWDQQAYPQLAPELLVLSEKFTDTYNARENKKTKTQFILNSEHVI